MDLSKYSIKELHALKKEIDKQINSRKKAEAKKAKDELKQVAEKYGFSLNELISGSPSAAKVRGKAPAKFQHPDDPSKTWSGRGRKPVWVKELEESGRGMTRIG